LIIANLETFLPNVQLYSIGTCNQK